MIKTGSNVTLHYTLSVDGEQIESSKGGDPLAYVHGEGQIIPGLEQQLVGLSVGDTKDAVIEPGQAYGQRDPEAVRSMPRDAFTDPDAVKVGDVVTGEAGGQPIRAQIVEVGNEEITVDLNHPLAGKTLRFEVEIVTVS